MEIEDERKECKKIGKCGACPIMLNWVKEHRKMIEDIYIKPMTPTRRAEIDEGFENAINELQGCEQNCLVKAQIGALLAYKRIIHNLPDGYPLPFTERGRE